MFSPYVPSKLIEKSQNFYRVHKGTSDSQLSSELGRLCVGYQPWVIGGCESVGKSPGEDHRFLKIHCIWRKTWKNLDRLIYRGREDVISLGNGMGIIKLAFGQKGELDDLRRSFSFLFSLMFWLHRSPVQMTLIDSCHYRQKPWSPKLCVSAPKCIRACPLKSSCPGRGCSLLSQPAFQRAFQQVS